MDLRELTTLRVGGSPRELLSPETPDELVRASLDVWASGEEWMALGGGSNIVVGDDGFDGSVIRVLTRGIEALPSVPGTARLRVQAGEPWDELVSYTVDRGLAGIEAMAGIPGSSGAGPIQNIGAYGQELSDTLVSVEFLDHETGRLEVIPAARLELGYRSSVFKAGRRGIVLSIELELTDAEGLSRPVASQQLATAIGAAFGDRIPVGVIRDAVLALRRVKGMVLDAADPDTTSAGSFFTNPLVAASFARALPPDAAQWPIEPDRVKLSAAWLIERAGIGRGFSLPGSGAAISSKHTLAIVNTGSATASDILELARFVQERVRNEFGVALQPEPGYIGMTSGD
ncbi:UDP-N-acetylmuramate dehydrogenase [Marisediminicola antarctica]